MGFERECGGDCGFVPVGEGERYRDGEQRVLMGRGAWLLKTWGGMKTLSKRAFNESYLWFNGKQFEV